MSPWTPRALVLALLVAPTGAHAQCVVAGTGIVRDVRPAGTDLRLGVFEEAQVTLDGTRAAVRGVTPIAFEGTARSRDVELSLESTRDLLGIIEASAGTELRVTRARPGSVTARVDLGPTRLWVELPCRALVFGEAHRDEAASVASAWTGATLQARVRGDVLRAFAGASGGTAVILRLRADGEHTWPLLEILGATEERVHVHAELDTGIVLDAWVERENLRPPPAVLSACGCDCLGSMGCGHGYGGESYRGAASLPAGTELSDGLGVVWGRLVVDAEVELVIARSASRGHAVGAPQPPVLETVWLERIPGLIADPCAGLGVHVPRAAVTLH